MSEQVVAALAKAVGLPLPPERAAQLAASLAGQISAGGGSTAEELDGVEPAFVFEPRWQE